VTRILPFLSDGGIAREWHDHEDGTITVVAQQDVAPILDINKAMATHNDGYAASRELRRAASIPNSLIHKWLVEEGWNAMDPGCAKKLKQKLNSSEYLYLRTAPGRL
jgi:hypothetical protein